MAAIGRRGGGGGVNVQRRTAVLMRAWCATNTMPTSKGVTGGDLATNSHPHSRWPTRLSHAQRPIMHAPPPPQKHKNTPKRHKNTPKRRGKIENNTNESNQPRF